MTSLWKLLGLIPVLAVLYVIAQLGSVAFALGLAGALAGIGLFMYATRKRPGHRYDKNMPSRADADLQTWDSSP